MFRLHISFWDELHTAVQCAQSERDAYRCGVLQDNKALLQTPPCDAAIASKTKLWTRSSPYTESQANLSTADVAGQ